MLAPPQYILSHIPLYERNADTSAMVVEMAIRDLAQKVRDWLHHAIRDSTSICAAQNWPMRIKPDDVSRSRCIDNHVRHIEKCIDRLYAAVDEMNDVLVAACVTTSARTVNDRRTMEHRNDGGLHGTVETYEDAVMGLVNCKKIYMSIYRSINAINGLYGDDLEVVEIEEIEWETPCKVLEIVD